MEESSCQLLLGILPSFRVYFRLECLCQLRGVTLAMFITQSYTIEVTLGLIQVSSHKYSSFEHKRDATLSPGKMWEMM